MNGFITLSLDGVTGHNFQRSLAGCIFGIARRHYWGQLQNVKRGIRMSVL